MNPFFEYLIKSTVSLALFYIVFKLAVSRDKMHSINRFVLLGIIVVSSVIPFADIPIINEAEVIPTVEVFREFVTAPVFIESPTVSENIQTVQQSKSISVNLYLIFYLVIISALFIRLLISVFRVQKIINGAEKQTFHKIILAVVKDFIQPFSFLKHIVISEKDYTENREIVVAHEYAHIKHLHSIDLLICELFTALHWFNPFMWFLRRDLKLIHEFQADQAVLNNGIDAKKYQLLVLQKSVGERRFALANNFTQKPILKRLKMMQKKNRKQWNVAKLILFIPVILLLLQAFARPEIIAEKASEFVPVIAQQDETEKWLERWTINNIGKGFFQPTMKSIDSPKKPNNVLVILLNWRNQFLIENKRAEKEDIKEIVKEFLHGINPDGKKGPDYIEKEISQVGKMKVSNGLISFKHDLDSSEEMKNYTLRAIGEACLEVRKEKSQILFGMDYFDLDEKKQEAVDMAAPIWFSYKEPKIMKPPPPPPPQKVVEVMEIKAPTVRIHENWISVDWKTCEFSNLYSKINQLLKAKRSGTVEIQIHEGTSEERIKEVYNELNRIPDLEIIRTDIKPPPPPPPKKESKSVKVHLNKNKLYFNGKYCKMEDLKFKVEDIIKQNPSIEKVELIFHEYEKLSKEVVAKVRSELKKIEGVEIKEIAVAVLPIKGK